MNSATIKPAAPAATEKFRILVVDDDPAVVRLLTTQLASAGFECCQASNGFSALEAFKSQAPHLVLLDVIMPHMDGREVCAKIREQSTVPIIMMTALSAEEDQVRGLKMGADDYIPKPFSPKVLMARLMATLRRAYRYDSCDTPAAAQAAPQASASSTSTADNAGGGVPSTWATCDSCGYMGPRNRFEYEDSGGKRSLRCPNCKQAEYITFSLG